MIDIHSHILYGIDDGPKTIEESVEMCRIAALDGIKTIVATPHFKPGVFEPDSIEVYERARILSERIATEGVELEILVGAEVSLTHETIAFVNKTRHSTLNGNSKYFLAETPFDCLPSGWNDHIRAIIKAGKIPVIAHPERNAYFMKYPEKLAELTAAGALVQITASSVTGEFGEDVQRACVRFLRNNIVHVMATDAHGAVKRPPLLSEAVDLVSDIAGEKAAMSLVRENPLAIIRGEFIAMALPVETPAGGRRWLQRLFA
ncbi:MAG: CpsB/CapC family capsule biosynthesis tyrosine phosphatase [Thermodesulfobacteriota bacterium]